MLKPCFLGHPIIINTNYPIKQVLKKPDLAGKVVAWSIELFEYDITFVLRSSVKS